MNIQDYLQSKSVHVHIVDLPHSVHGLVMMDGDGGYVILINARDSYARQINAFNHELKHILKNQVYQTGYSEY